MAKKSIKKVISKNASDIASALGLPKSTSLEWQVRHSVNEEIIRIFSESGLSKTDFAEISGTSRGRITRILKKDTSDISLDVLFRVLGATGAKIAFKFSKAS